MIGWIVNNDPIGEYGVQPSYFVAEQVHQELYKPEMLGRVLRRNGLNLAQIGTPSQVRPPVVEILEPRDRVLTVGQPRITILARATEVGCHKVTEMDYYISGDDRRKRGTLKNVSLVRPGATAQGQERSMTVDLEPGRNEITVFARTDVNIGYSDPIYVTYEAPVTLPHLHVLSVGISNYSRNVATPPDPIEFCARGREQGRRGVTCVDKGRFC